RGGGRAARADGGTPPPAGHRPALRRDPLDRVGDRRPAGLLLAGHTRVRPPRPATARRRRHLLARSVRAGPAHAAAPPLDVYRRRPRGRRRPGRPPPRPPRGRENPHDEEGLMNTHPLATSVAAAVADRALDRLGPHLTDEIRLRALLPGGPIEEHGRDAVLARFDDWFGSYDTVVLADV